MTQELLISPMRLADRALTMLSTVQRDGLDILEFYELSEQIVVRWMTGLRMLGSHPQMEPSCCAIFWRVRVLRPVS